jgi:hypothetical protein
MVTIASSTLISEAGRSLACGSLAAITAPVSRSLTIHEAAVIAGGSAAPEG